MNHHSKSPVSLRASREVALLVLALLPACAAMPDDVNPELAKRTGPRATVEVVQGAFAYSGGGGAGGEITTTGPDGPRTVSWSVRGTSYGWSKESAQALEVFFRRKLAESGAVYVIQAGAAPAGGAADTATVPDLRLVCTLTRFQDNAKSKKSSGSFGMWTQKILAWVTGGAYLSRQRGDCTIAVEIYDSKGRLVATAEGKGFAVGGSQGMRAGGSQLGLFGGLGTEEQTAVDMSAAVERATINAINNVIGQIPAKFFKHDFSAEDDAVPTTTTADATATSR